MKSKSFQRVLLLASGLCAVVVIFAFAVLLSGCFCSRKIAKNEKSSEKKEVAIHAPSDVASQGQAFELNPTQPSVVEELVLPDSKNENAVFIQKIATNFFKTLFRVIISPNAP